jgi:hypothetical protein
VGANVFLVIEQTGPQVFFLSLTSLMQPYIVKMTWSRQKNALNTEDLIFYLVPSECSEEISHRGRENVISRKNIIT